MMSPPPPVVATPSKGKRRKGLIVLGLILLLGGVLGGGAMVAKSMSNYEESVKSLARAPVGCTTTLVFEKPATFTVYIETKGKLGELGGDCETGGGDYTHPGDKLPKVSLTLVDSKGNEVTMDRGVTATYDVSGFKGTGVRSMAIEEAGTYRLNVESDDADFAVAIGKDPKKDSDLLKAVGGGVALGGFVLGLLFLLLGLRRRRVEPAMADIRNPAAPMPGWPPSAYPGMPPAPPAPPGHPGFRPEPPAGPQPIGLPGQPPIRLPEQPAGGGFAPPTLAPPPPPSDPPPAAPPTVGPPSAPPTSYPTLPPSAAPPSAAPPRPAPPPPPAPSGGGWAVPDDPDED
jgi:hypothetical protein